MPWLTKDRNTSSGRESTAGAAFIRAKSCPIPARSGLVRIACAEQSSSPLLWVQNQTTITVQEINQLYDTQPNDHRLSLSILDLLLHRCPSPPGNESGNYIH